MKIKIEKLIWIVQKFFISKSSVLAKLNYIRIYEKVFLLPAVTTYKPVIRLHIAPQISLSARIDASTSRRTYLVVVSPLSWTLVLGVGLGPTISKLSVWCLTNLATPTYKTDFFDCVRVLPIELSPRVEESRTRTYNIVLPKQKSFEIAVSVFIFFYL